MSNLMDQTGVTGLECAIGRCRRVRGRVAKDRVRDVQAGTCNACSGEGLVESTACRANERRPFDDLVTTRALSNNPPTRVRRSPSRHDQLAHEWAATAASGRVVRIHAMIVGSRSADLIRLSRVQLAEGACAGGMDAPRLTSVRRH